MRTLPGLILIAVTSVLATMAPASSGAQTPSAGSDLLDLPAIVLSPGDADAAGIEGTGRFENGHFRSETDYSAIRSEFLNIPLEEVEAVVSESGYLQGYTSNLGIPEEPGNPDSPPSRVVFSSVYQYATAEGAAIAWEFNTDYSGVTVANVDTSLVPSTPIGDQAVMTRTTSSTMEEEGPSDQIDTAFRVGNVVAATGIIDYGMTVEEVEDPPVANPAIVAQVEQLAARLIDRITDAQSGEVPGLSLQSLALSAEGADAGFSSEGYRLIGGESIPYYNGYEDDLGLFLSPDMISVYEVAQGLGAPAMDPFDPFFASRLFAFTDDSGAVGYLGDVPGLLPPGFDVVQPTANFTEGAILVEYAFEIGPGVEVMGYQVWQQSGNIVTAFVLESADHRPAQEVVAEIATAQIACLVSTCEPFPLPSGW